MAAPLLTLTPQALERVKHLLAQRDKPALGVRIGVRTKGCSGLSYTLEYADAPAPLDERIDAADGVVVLVDPKAVLFLVGTQMDYVEDALQSGFVFRNPNEKGRCGCGESFHV